MNPPFFSVKGEILNKDWIIRNNKKGCQYNHIVHCQLSID